MIGVESFAGCEGGDAPPSVVYLAPWIYGLVSDSRRSLLPTGDRER
ncbi:hypothetical protein [Streptomyces sp. TP-A0356]|nr:hypothetical protein [Streptomyces sp. TP-A0356]